MPRPKKPGAPEPKRRSRNGCWNCKARKVKCGEEHPSCVNCQRTNEECDYSIRLNWDGRKKKNPGYETLLFQDPSGSSSSAYRPPRPPSEETSTSSTVVTPQATTADQHSPPTDTSPHTEGPSSIPRSEPRSAISTKASAKAPFPGAHVFTAHSAAYLQDDGDAPPLRSPDLTSPMFSLPRPHSKSASVGSYARLSEPSQARGACPPPFKRLRYSDELDASHSAPEITSPVSQNDPASAAATPRLLSSALAPAGGGMESPLTPAASSPYSEEGSLARLPSLRQAALSPDVRRMSVNSLLSGPPGPAGPAQYAPPSQRALNARTNLCLSEVTTYYGLDPGFPDLDLGINDDANAIRLVVADEQPDVLAAGDTPSVGESARGRDRCMTGPGGYYERPVAVRIPRDLEPLPAKLRENPMNLLYFHHFMNHTAKALVPHDDRQSNPYRHVLPQMAVKNDNLLSLMLAYSASHRAHLLGHPEPATRIAHWVQDIFPALRRALNDPNQSISNANIATGIMLASLEIVSPTAFGYQIPWQRHLGLARDLIADRPDGIRWTRDWTEEDQVRAFLWSWLAYLDVLGSLSGGRGSSVAWILEYQKDEFEEEWDEIDCIMGITTQAVYILAKTAELVKECEALRAAEREGKAEISAAATVWEPPKDIVRRAWAVENEATASMARPPQPCKHLHASGNVARWEQRGIAALNEAYHWAIMVHLHRRVLGRPSGHEDVQAAVLKIHACLALVPLGSDAEASMLFPLFTAACETVGEELRARVRDRLDSIRRTGFLQVEKARALIEKVWTTGQSCDVHLTTEFIG
ncbi:unnamed protein product [Discula destructiva]